MSYVIKFWPFSQHDDFDYREWLADGAEVSAKIVEK